MLEYLQIEAGCDPWRIIQSELKNAPNLKELKFTPVKYTYNRKIDFNDFKIFTDSLKVLDLSEIKKPIVINIEGGANPAIISER